MTLKSYPYSSAVISCRQVNLLTKEVLLNAASSDTADSAMMVFKEKGYAKGGPELENMYQFETVISYEMKKTIAFLKEVAPEEKLLNLFLLKYDYLNAKTLLKLNLKGNPFTEKDITPYGTITFDLLETSIENQSYDKLPIEMAEAMKKIDKAFVVNEDASLIGLTLDEAYAAQVKRLIAGEKNPLIVEYFKAFFDFTNIITVLRMKSSGYRPETVKSALLEGGKMSTSDMMRVFEGGSEGGLRQVIKYEYQKCLTDAFEIYEAGGGLFAIEKARDDYLMAVLKKDRFDVFSSSKVISFLIAKEREAAAVRLLMVSVLNRISADEITRRLKDLYY